MPNIIVVNSANQVIYDVRTGLYVDVQNVVALRNEYEKKISSLQNELLTINKAIKAMLAKIHSEELWH